MVAAGVLERVAAIPVEGIMPAEPATPVRRPRVLITGASGGIGEAFAHIVADEGFDLVVVARQEGELNRVRGIIAARHPALNIAVIARDLSEPGAVQQIHDELKQRDLLPDIVVNNAGYGLLGQQATLPVDGQLGIVDVNVRALTDMCLRFLPHMLARQGGGILNIASTAAFMPGPYMAVYYASKAFVLSFSEGLAAELERTGVTVTVLCPGPVVTGFQARAGMRSFGLLQRMMALPARDVALAGWEGFKQRRRVVIPGFLNATAALAASYAPRFLSLPIIRSLQAPR